MTDRRQHARKSRDEEDGGDDGEEALMEFEVDRAASRSRRRHGDGDSDEDEDDGGVPDVPRVEGPQTGFRAIGGG